MEHPSYYSILTADVRYDKRLKPNEKLLFSEITALSNKRGYCNASNNYFAQLYDVTTVTASNWVNHLKDRGYIDVEMIYDGKQIKERRIFVSSNPIKENFNTPKEKVEDPIKNNFKGGIKEKFKENITRSNNTSKNKQLEEDFNKLWKLYPRKEGKKKAFEAYKRAIKKGTTNKEIQTGIVNYLTQINVQGTDKKYIKQGSTWFNGECWDDEYNLGESQASVNPKEKTGDSPSPRSREEEELEARKQSAEAFLYNLREHPEYFEIEHMKAAINDFVTKNPELKEEVLEIARTRGKSDRNTA